MRQNLNQVSEGNTTQAPPYGSTAEGLLYEIMMDLGGPGLGGQLPFRAENPTGAPPYKSTAEGLLYEILGAIKNGGGAGAGTGTTTVYVGWVKDGNSVNIEQLAPVKVIAGVQQYSVLAPIVLNITGNETEMLNLVIVEPTAEPIKNSALLYRVSGSSFVRGQVNVSSLFSTQNVGANRIYRSEPIESYLADGSQIGPVVLSTIHSVATDFADVDPLPASFAYRVRIGVNPCGSDLVTVYSPSPTFEEGIQLYINKALSIPAGSGMVAPYDSDGIAIGTITIAGEIFPVTDGLVGASTNTVC